MKSILMSISADNNANIEIGKKIAELRTRAPKIEPPFKVFTYESDGRGKITNDWICSKIDEWRICVGIPSHLSKVACVDNSYIWEYSGRGKKNICEMSISDLKIYATPKSLSDFVNTKGETITRAPQSWQYCELKER